MMRRLGSVTDLARVAALSCSVFLYAGNGMAEEELKDVRASLTDVEGTSIHANEEEPRVLHIVPWQPPTLARRERTPPELSGVETLLRPIDVEAFRTHRRFRQTLDILNVDRSGPCGVQKDCR